MIQPLSSRSEMSALHGVRVLDLSGGRAGPLAAMLLADFGAEVVRIAPGGHPVWDRGKRVVDADRAALVGGADVVVTGELLDAHERAVVLHVPPTLGPPPWAGGAESDALITAWYGIPLRQGSFDGGPVDSIYPVVTTLQGIWAAACAVAALIERERSGLGQSVTVSGDHGAMIAAAGALTFRTGDVENPPPRRVRGPGGAIPFYRTYECADGRWLFFAALTPRFTQLGFEVLGLTGLFDDERLGGRGRAAMISPEHSEWVTQTIAARFKTRPREEWLAQLRAVGCPSGPIDEREDWLDHPQVRAVGMRVEADDPLVGPIVMPGVPVTLHATPGTARPRVFGGAPSWGPRDPAPRDVAGRHGPLDGFRVLDLGAIIAGPFSASLLGDLGADVVKVEPLTGDSFRGPGFAAYNKGQRGVALDLQKDAGRDAFLDLVRTADVVVDNYRPRVLQRLRIDWDSLRAVNPNVISASITGFGEGGPYGGDAGFDPVLQAMSGMMRAQGGDSDPVFFTVPVNDVAGSASLAFGALLALLHRERTGEPQRVSTSLTAMSVLLQTEALSRYAGRPPAPLGSRDHVGPSATDRFHRTADGWIRAHGEAPDDSERRPRDEVLKTLYEAGVPAVAARTLSELAGDPDVVAGEILHADPRPDRDGFTSGRHARFSRTMRAGALVSPSLGEHTRDVLREIGYADETIDELIASGAAVG
jgi:crotonobetainyl-CoA:carnitine CoA-transferase CaiB-like acyl-CoA transferase